MKNILTIGILLAISTVIGGCTKTLSTEITFDQFSCKISTKDVKLEEITQEEQKLFKDEQNIYKIYTITNKSGFTDSLLIAKEKMNLDISLERMVQINMKKLENRLIGFESDDVSQINIPCGERNITGYLQSFNFDSVTPDETIYINQYFFQDQGNTYIISSSTEESGRDKSFRKGIKDIKCLKQ